MPDAQAPPWQRRGGRRVREAVRTTVVKEAVTTGDLVEHLRTSQANVSGHLACLKDCGLVTDRPLGRANYYRLAQPELAALLRSAGTLLAAVGHNVDLCCNYEQPGRSTRSTKRSA